MLAASPTIRATSDRRRGTMATSAAPEMGRSTIVVSSGKSTMRPSDSCPGHDVAEDQHRAGRDSERVVADVPALHPAQPVAAVADQRADAVDGAVDDLHVDDERAERGEQSTRRLDDRRIEVVDVPASLQDGRLEPLLAH